MYCAVMFWPLVACTLALVATALPACTVMPAALMVCNPVDCNEVASVVAVTLRLPAAVTFIVPLALTAAFCTVSAPPPVVVSTMLRPSTAPLICIFPLLLSDMSFNVPPAVVPVTVKVGAVSTSWMLPVVLLAA